MHVKTKRTHLIFIIIHMELQKVVIKQNSSFRMQDLFNIQKKWL